MLMGTDTFITYALLLKLLSSCTTKCMQFSNLFHSTNICSWKLEIIKKRKRKIYNLNWDRPFCCCICLLFLGLHWWWCKGLLLIKIVLSLFLLRNGSITQGLKSFDTFSILHWMFVINPWVRYMMLEGRLSLVPKDFSHMNSADFTGTHIYKTFNKDKHSFEFIAEIKIKFILENNEFS